VSEDGTIVKNNLTINHYCKREHLRGGRKRRGVMREMMMGDGNSDSICNSSMASIINDNGGTSYSIIYCLINNSSSGIIIIIIIIISGPLNDN
jgi:hypothetical protein